MKSKLYFIIKWAVPVFAICVTGLYVNAQKLPNIQLTNLPAPTKIKIDGRLNEWGDKLQAYNHNTQMYYTIANDDKKLYLAIKITDENVIRKAVVGGLTLTIGTSADRRGKNMMSITFPAYDKKNPPLYLILNNRPVATKDTLKYEMQVDSFMRACNDQISKKLITIGVEGLKTIAETDLSIYNEYGINASSLFDNKIAYICELAIPLKQIGLSLSERTKFKYNIQLNGIGVHGSNFQTISSSHGDMITYTGGDGINYVVGLATPQNMTLTYPTDFWGEYTLVSSQ